MQALQRILAILEVVANTPDGATATEVSAATGLSLSTVSRLLHQLVSEDALDRTRDGRYTVGWRLISLARSGSDRFDIRKRVQPILEDLRDTTGETASLHTRSGTNRICIAAEQSHHAVARTVQIGLSLGLVGSATGHVLLAGTTPSERDELYPDMPMAQRQDLEASISQARDQGWLLIADRWQAGVTGLSATVRKGRRGDGPIAALSISGPSERFTATAATAWTDVLVAAAARVSDLYEREF